MKPNVLTVSQVNKYIKSLLEDDIILNELFVEGEISNFTKHSSGHLYFTLKDDNAAISCVMFKSNAQSVRFAPESGMKCIAFGRISLYEKSGQYQLYVQILEPSGIGGLHAAFEQLKQKLAGEGLFDDSRKKEIPKLARCIAVITSPTGAAVRDIINVAKRRDKSVEIVVVPVKVQGEGAADSIRAAIKLVNKWGKADVIIVGRGGGSIEDLWAFNEEQVARAVYASKIPVISAVGHETDFTIADFVADLRAPTPSAAAEIAVYNRNEIIDKVQYLTSRLKRNMTRIYDYEQILARFNEKMKRELFLKLSANKMKLGSAIGLLHQLSPLTVLNRGFALAYDENDNMVTSVDGLQKGDTIKVRLKDGAFTSKVINVDKTRVGKNGS